MIRLLIDIPDDAIALDALATAITVQQPVTVTTPTETLSGRLMGAQQVHN